MRPLPVGARCSPARHPPPRAHPLAGVCEPAFTPSRPSPPSPLGLAGGLFIPRRRHTSPILQWLRLESSSWYPCPLALGTPSSLLMARQLLLRAEGPYLAGTPVCAPFLRRRTSGGLWLSCCHIRVQSSSWTGVVPSSGPPAGPSGRSGFRSVRNQRRPAKQPPRFAIPPAVNEGSCRSTSAPSPVSGRFWILAVLTGRQQRPIDVLIALPG